MYIYVTVPLSQGLIEAEQPLPAALCANPVLPFVAFTNSQHDIRLCNHVNTTEEKCHELEKMEKTRDAVLPRLSAEFNLKTHPCRDTHLSEMREVS